MLNEKKESIIDTIFDELYESKNNLFLNFISTFCVKDDSNIKRYILKINDKLSMLHDKENYLSNYIIKEFDDIKIEEDISKFTNLLKDKLSEIDILLSKISYYVESDYFDSLEKSLKQLIKSSTYDEIKNNLGVKTPNLPRGSDELVKQYKTEISAILKELSDMCIWNNREEIKNSIKVQKIMLK